MCEYYISLKISGSYRGNQRNQKWKFVFQCFSVVPGWFTEKIHTSNLEPWLLATESSSQIPWKKNKKNASFHGNTVVSPINGLVTWSGTMQCKMRDKIADLKCSDFNGWGVEDQNVLNYLEEAILHSKNHWTPYEHVKCFQWRFQWIS